MENTQASGRKRFKELGKITGRNFGRCPANALEVLAAVKEAERLFNKNTGLCKAERRSIGADACPVLVS